MKIILGGLFLTVAVLGTWVALVLVPLSGVFHRLEPLLVDQCRTVEVAPGTEDVEIDEETGQVFISTYDRRDWYRGDISEGTPGAIYLLDLNDRTLTPRLISQSAPADFSPHGISLWRGGNGERRLFVVNHRTDGVEAIEMFDIDADGALFHTETVSFEELYSPNDVVAVGYRAFYASNDKRFEAGVLQVLETYLALSLTDVVYFDGVSGTIAASDLAYANGVNISAAGTELYVAEVLKRRITVFDRDLVTGALSIKKRIPLNTAGDNIDVAPDGSLYVGGHPKILDFVAHAEDEKAISPSHVVRVDPASGDTKDVFISVNGEINGSSVGAANDDVLIVGAVFDGHVMVCPLPQ